MADDSPVQLNPVFSKPRNGLFSFSIGLFSRTIKYSITFPESILIGHLPIFLSGGDHFFPELARVRLSVNRFWFVEVDQPELLIGFVA